MRIALNIGVAVTALLLGLLGIRWMFVPESIATEQGVGLEGLIALSTARGDLGGFFIGGAVLCALGLRPGQGRLLVAVAIVVGAVATGRAVGLVADGFHPSILLFIAIEVAMVAVLLLAARQPAAESR